MPLCGLVYSLGESPDPELHVHTNSSLRSPSAVGTPRGFNKLSSEMINRQRMRTKGSKKRETTSDSTEKDERLV